MTTATETEILDRAEINGSTVIVEYSRTEAALADLRGRYEGVVFDLTTTKGDKEARAARLELTTLRTSLEKKRKEFKAPALEFGKRIDSEAARVTAEIEALEKPIDAQIKADEARRAAEKAERDRLAAERIALYQGKIAAIRACVARCQGITAERISNGIAQVELIDVSPEAMAEFSGEASLAKAETLEAMRTLHEATKAREEYDARVEAQRIENERVAAEQRRQAEALAAQQAALEKVAADLKAEQERIAAENARAEQRAAAERARKEEEAAAESRRQIEAEERAALAVAVTPQAESNTGAASEMFQDELPSPAAPAQAANVAPLGRPAPVATSAAPTLRLGEINTRLGVFNITADGLRALGFEIVAKDRAACLYRESDWPHMLAAMVEHLQAVQAKQAA